jgi:hypothetical protein
VPVDGRAADGFERTRLPRSTNAIGAWLRKNYELSYSHSGLLAPPPLPQKLPIAPIFIADLISLAVSREKDWKLRIVYAGWDDAKVVEPSEVLELRAS